MNYKISIIIPCYSVGINFVEEAIESIQNQTYSNWEIVFVDDCSPLQEWKSEKLNSIPKEKLKIIKNKENVYAAQSRNIGFENSSGDIILFLDADDKYTSTTFFEYLINKFNENPDLDLIFYKWYRSKKFKNNLKINDISENYFTKASMQDYVINFFAVSPCLQAIKKKFLEKNNIKFFNNRNICEDWIYCYQIFTSDPNTLYVNALFYFYRKRLNSSTSKIGKYKTFSVIDSINEFCKDLERLKTMRGGGYLDLSSNQPDLWFLSLSLTHAILSFGFKNTKKKLLQIKLDKELIKRINSCIEKMDLKILNLVRKYKLEWIYTLFYRALLIIN